MSNTSLLSLLAMIILVVALSNNIITPVTAGSNNLPFVLGVRDSFMIAHSFHNNPNFGPAGGLHGATYTCDVEFSTKGLVSGTNWVIDIGKASELLGEVLKKYNYQNLDEVFGEGVLTTTEFMAKQIHNDLCERLREECKDFQGNICVKLWESHKAWASYEGRI